jgi:DNA polymerase elongation subunit (family B)
MPKKVNDLLTNGRILVWDIETTDFKANFGHLLMWSAKFVGEDEVYYSRIDETKGYGKTPHSFMDDKRLVEELIPLIEEADAIVHHYGDRFDLRFLNTRALENNLLPPAPPTTIDTWKIARNNLAMTSNRLGVLAESFAREDRQKGGLSKEQWKLAVHGHKPTLDAMLDYCIHDVLATEDVYVKLMPLIRNHPYVGPAAAPDQRRTQCPACGSIKTCGNGVRRTKIYEVYRQRCQNCGNSFERGRKKIA